MAKTYTPGPWVAICNDPYEFEGHLLQSCNVYTVKTRKELNDDGYSYNPILADVSNIEVCQVSTFQKDIKGDEAKANAILIAAAPDMLAALREIAAGQQGELKGEFIRRAQEVAKSAIKKATGGEE